VVSVASVAQKAWQWQQFRRTSMYAHHTGTERKSDTARSYSAVIASTSSALLERRDVSKQHGEAWDRKYCSHLPAA